MNKELIKILKDENIHPISYQKIKSVYVINNYYVIKLNTNNYDIYKYLVSRDYLLFPKSFSKKENNYDISLFINNLTINDEQKITEYIKTIALLHKKTSYKREINLDEVKEKYEYLKNKIISLREYYLKLNDKLDNELFLNPSAYLLLRNISLIYNTLNNIENLLNEIYQVIKDDKSIRVSLIHNNTNLDHLIISDNKYLVSWDKAMFDNPIYEIKDIYRKYYNLIELNDLINIYESINKLTDIEMKSLLIILAIPNEIKLTNNTFNDTKKINNEVNYLNKVNELLKNVFK